MNPDDVLPMTLAGRKPRLLLCGHTYGAAVNLAKPKALSRWFEVMVCAPDFTGMRIMGRDGALQHGSAVDSRFAFRRLRRWPGSQGFSRCFYSGLGRVFREFQPEVVLYEGEVWFSARWQSRFLAWRQKSKPIFIEFTWENVARPGIKGLILKWFYTMAALTSDGVVCGNRGAEALVRKAGVPTNKILRTGQLGIDPDEHPALPPDERVSWRRRLGLSPDAFVIGFCGRLVEEKGIMHLWDAVERLRRDQPRAVLVILGAGPLEKELKRRASGVSWARLLPPVDHAEVPAFLAQLDLFVLPSKPQLDPARGNLWEEQFGHVLIEAMACGTPCIGCNSGAIPEVLENDAEALFQAGSDDAIKERILDLVSSPDRLAALAIRQCRHTRARWSHDALAVEYAGFIQGIMGSKRSAG